MGRGHDQGYPKKEEMKTMAMAGTGIMNSSAIPSVVNASNYHMGANGQAQGKVGQNGVGYYGAPSGMGA